MNTEQRKFKKWRARYKFGGLDKWLTLSAATGLKFDAQAEARRIKPSRWEFLDVRPIRNTAME